MLKKGIVPKRSELIFPWVVAALPFAYLIHSISKYYVDVPYWDEWVITVPLLNKAFSGGLSLRDFWTQNNEHRIFFSELIIVPLAAMTHWNQILEVFINVFLSLGSFTVIVCKVIKNKSAIGEPALRWLIPGISVILFSLGQWENWLWGHEMNIFLCVLASLLGITALADLKFQWRRFFIAMLSGVIANYSWGAGFVYWPVSLWLLLFTAYKHKKQMLAVLSLWCFICFLTVFIYFAGYQAPTHHSFAYVWSGWHGNDDVIRRSFYFICFFLGNIFAPPLAFQTGFAGLSVFLTGSIVLLLNKRSSKEGYVWLIALGLFSAGSAILAAAGRIGFERGVLGRWATASRYSTLVFPFWVSLMIMGALFAHKAIDVKNKFVRAATRYFAMIFCFLIIVLAAHHSFESERSFKDHSDKRSLERDQLIATADAAALSETIKDDAIDLAKNNNKRFLKKWKLSIFRNE